MIINLFLFIYLWLKLTYNERNEMINNNLGQLNSRYILEESISL